LAQAFVSNVSGKVKPTVLPLIEQARALSTYVAEMLHLDLGTHLHRSRSGYLGP
jgi:hypothetical protein